MSRFAMKAGASPLGRIIGRILLEGLIWIPVWLLLSASSGSRVSGSGAFSLALVLFAVGLVLHVTLPTVWRRVAMIVLLAIIAVYAFSSMDNAVVVFIWWGIALWRGRYAHFGHLQAALGFGIATGALALIAADEVWRNYRPEMIVLTVGWMLAWFLLLNKRLMDEAALLQGIATGSIRKASRTYMHAFLAIGVLVVALTVSFGSRWLTPPNSLKPDTGWIDSEKFLQPPDDTGSMNLTEQLGPGSTWKGWNVLTWVISVFCIILVLLFIRMMWRNKTWTWRSIWQSLLALFRRERPEETLPYVEERRSLAKRRGFVPAFGGLFHKKMRKADWDKLDETEQIRLMYEEAVLSGIVEGFEFRPSDTPAETLARLERHRTDRRAPDSKKLIAYWAWFAGAKPLLQRLYEQAKYSSRKIGTEEADRLKRDRPN
ncbi:hypothetical protein [Cohnella soli]|uniref:DUF4129 domain-containing protein n=1 Tax=Cohnella soli TaxID=425005 RepID=A0ABW0HMR8_9BACL